MISKNDFPDIFLRLSFTLQPEGWESKTFLENICRVSREPTRGLCTRFGKVSTIGYESYDLSLMKYCF